MSSEQKNHRAISGTKGKLWGTTSMVYLGPFTEVHYLEINPGTRCSTHIHEGKTNRFVVLSGELNVVVQKNSGIEDTTNLKAGMFTDVPPGEKHRFECPHDCEGCVCLEIYWVNLLDPNDIVRDDTGGKLDG